MKTPSRLKCEALQLVAKRARHPSDVSRMRHISNLVPRPETLEGRVHHSDLQVSRKLVFSTEEVTSATEYVFERSPTRRAIAC